MGTTDNKNNTNALPSGGSSEDQLARGVSFSSTVIFPGISHNVNIVGGPYADLMIKAQESGEELVALFSCPTESGKYEKIGTTIKVVSHEPPKQAGVPIAFTVEGVARVAIHDIEKSDPPTVSFSLAPEKVSYANIIQEKRQTVMEGLARYPNFDQDLKDIAGLDHDPVTQVYLAACRLSFGYENRKKILFATDLSLKFDLLHKLIETQFLTKKTDNDIQDSVKNMTAQEERRQYLLMQREAINRELGEDEGAENDGDELKKKIADAKLPETVKAKVNKEYKRLRGMSPHAAGADEIRNYINTVLDFPWLEKTPVNHDYKKARDTLESHHYGLDDVKKQVLKHLAVEKRLAQQQNGDDTENKAPKIICLVGPPGIGKTSVAQSIAEATGRKYVRMALGGVRDEAEIRGHRRTYIGSKVGKIAQNMIKAGTNNPLFVLDEIDKIGKDHRGDPSDALLEVLDPAQNKAFEDHYLEEPVDLSNVMFIATANAWGAIPAPLRDRMETIFLDSYTPEEKFEIAKRHLVTRQMKAHGLTKDDLSIGDDALQSVINHYTREAGVRNLAREIGNICAEAVVRLEHTPDAPITVTADNVTDFLGPHKHSYETAAARSQTGVVTGLAYTSVGGETLKIEVSKWPETSHKITISGNLGSVMKESVQVASVLLKSKAKSFGLDLKTIANQAFHVHVPAGATPKDGPSAGAAMTTAIFSEALEKPVRGDVAMTGEITSKGEVTAIGGLREKLSAATRAGCHIVIIPRQNEKDLYDVPQQIKDKLDIRPVSTIEEVLDIAIEGGFKPHPAAANDTAPPAATAASPRPSA